MPKKEKNAENEPEIVESSESKFSKKQILSAKRFKNRKDIVSAVLSGYSDSVMFGISEVEKMIEDYMKGKVN